MNASIRETRITRPVLVRVVPPSPEEERLVNVFAVLIGVPIMIGSLLFVTGGFFGMFYGLGMYYLALVTIKTREHFKV